MKIANKNMSPVFLLSFLWLLRAICIISLDPQIPTFDEVLYYIPLAENFLKFGRYTLSTSPPFIAETLKTPGYPLWIAFIFLLTNKSVLAVRFAQVILDAGTLFFTTKL